MYTLIPTHDVDFWSARELPLLSRAHWAYVTRAVIRNWGRLGKDLALRDYVAGLVSSGLLTMRIGHDPWVESFHTMIQMERDRGIRSTIFVVPFAGLEGVLEDGRPAPRGRAVRYRLEDIAPVLVQLQGEGWEIGVHGISGHVSADWALREREELERYGLKVQGYRSHWLITSRHMREFLRRAGYLYDSSVKSTLDAAVRPHVDKSDRPFAVLPIGVQDKDVLGDEVSTLAAWERITPYLEHANRLGGVVTVLWHTNHFGPPRFWGSLYERILDHAARHGARVVTAAEFVHEAIGCQSEVGR